MEVKKRFLSHWLKKPGFLTLIVTSSSRLRNIRFQFSSVITVNGCPRYKRIIFSTTTFQSHSCLFETNGKKYIASAVGTRVCWRDLRSPEMLWCLSPHLPKNTTSRPKVLFAELYKVSLCSRAHPLFSQWRCLCSPYGIC